MPNVAFKRPEIAAKTKEYKIISDAIGGSMAVKRVRQEYLPKPNAEDNSLSNAKRYEAYLTRAVYYNVTGRTLRGLIGQLFYRDPVIEVPANLQPVVDDANGEGVSLVQLAKKAASYVVPLGRSGLFVDYPKTSGVVTKEQLETESIRPTVKVYSPDKIINWRTIKRGAMSVLSLVVLEENYIEKDDGFEIKHGTQWRVLSLVDNVYTVEIWRKGPKVSFALVDTAVPTNAKGEKLTDIPFCFIGAENNDSEVDFAPMFDLADLNIAHFRNSADHEENLYISAQATPVITGLSESWADKYFKEGVGLGSRAAIPLPVGGNATLIQAEAQSALSTEMEHKERQMVALGAKLVEQKQVQRTATEAGLEEASETSILSTIAGNLSLAFQWALGWCAEFVDTSEVKIVFTINSDFSLAKMTPQERQQVIAEWQAEAITFGEMRAALRKSGVATLSDDQARDTIEVENPVDDFENPDDKTEPQE